MVIETYMAMKETNQYIDLEVDQLLESFDVGELLYGFLGLEGTSFVSCESLSSF